MLEHLCLVLSQSLCGFVWKMLNLQIGNVLSLKIYVYLYGESVRIFSCISFCWTTVMHFSDWFWFLSVFQDVEDFMPYKHITHMFICFYWVIILCFSFAFFFLSLLLMRTVPQFQVLFICPVFEINPTCLKF